MAEAKNTHNLTDWPAAMSETVTHHDMVGYGMKRYDGLRIVCRYEVQYLEK